MQDVTGKNMIMTDLGLYVLYCIGIVHLARCVHGYNRLQESIIVLISSLHSFPFIHVMLYSPILFVLLHRRLDTAELFKKSTNLTAFGPSFFSQWN